MLRPVIFLLTILFTGVPGAAWADNVPTNRTVVKIFTYDSYAVVRYSPAFANSLGCGGGAFANSNAAILFDTNADKKAQLAVVMMAMSLKQKIGFGISGCFGWGGGIPKVYRVDVAD